MGADALFLPAVLALGVVSTLQDIRVRRISNLWIIIGLGYALLAHAYLLVSANQQESFWGLHILTNVLAGAIIAVYFWKQNWWGGGDAKLFVCYCALIPLSHYPCGYFGYYFASFLLLIMTFVPAAVWTFFHAQFNLAKSKKSIYSNFNPSTERRWELLQLGVGFTAIFFLSNLLTLFLMHYVQWINDFPIIIWLLSITYYKFVFRLFKKRWWLALGAWTFGICCTIFVPYFHQINIWGILTNSFAYCMLIFILRLHVFRTIDMYVDTTKDNSLAFAGWMFLGGLVIWYSKIILSFF